MLLSDSAVTSPYWPQEHFLYRGIRLQNVSDQVIVEFFTAHLVDQEIFLPDDPVEIGSKLVTHLNGLTSKNAGFVSTSINQSLAATFGTVDKAQSNKGWRGFLMKIRTPKNAISIERFAQNAKGKSWDHGYYSGFPIEKEVVIPGFIRGDWIEEIVEIRHAWDWTHPQSGWGQAQVIKRWSRNANATIVVTDVVPEIILPSRYD